MIVDAIICKVIVDAIICEVKFAVVNKNKPKASSFGLYLAQNKIFLGRF